MYSEFLSFLNFRSIKCLWHFSSDLSKIRSKSWIIGYFYFKSSLSRSAAFSIPSISWPQWLSFKMQSMQTNYLSMEQKASSFLKCLLHVWDSSSANEKSLDPDLLVCYWICKSAQFWGKSSIEVFETYSTPHV